MYIVRAPDHPEDSDCAQALSTILKQQCQRQDAVQVDVAPEKKSKGGEAGSLEEWHGDGQDEVGPVAPPEDGNPGVLHALQGLIGQHDGVKLCNNILGAAHLLQHCPGLSQVPPLHQAVGRLRQEQPTCNCKH